MLALTLLLSPAPALARQQGGGGEPGFSYTVAMQSLLQRAARGLFEVPAGELVRVKWLSGDAAYEHSAALEKFEVIDRGGRSLGRFVRLQVLAEEGTTIDLALRFEEDRLIGLVPMQPIVIGGMGFLKLPALLRELSPHPVSGWSPEVSRVFASLLYLGRAAEGRDGPPAFTDDEARLLLASVKQRTPPLPAGTPMPPLGVSDEDGRPLGPARFTGRRGLVVVALAQTSTSARVLPWIRRYLDRRPGRYRAAFVLVNRPAQIEQYRVRGGGFGGALVAADPKGVAQEALRVAAMPAVLLFDREARLVRHIGPPHESYEALEAALDAQE